MTAFARRMPEWREAALRIGHIDGDCIAFESDQLDELNRRYPQRLADKAVSLLDALQTWREQGYPVADSDTVVIRLTTCKSCSHWIPDSFFQTGSCGLCGCSRMKLFLSTSTCDAGKW